MYMRASMTDVNTLGYFISLVHLFPTFEVLLSLIEALMHRTDGSIFVKKMTFLAHDNGHVKPKKTQNSPD